MPSLTRRRSDNPHQVTWHVYYGDVHVGKIGERAGVPVDVDPWHWSCGFYPGLHPGQHRYGTAIARSWTHISRSLAVSFAGSAVKR
jgi:hypothetical protein